MTPKEQTRLQVLNRLLAERMTLDQAAELMGLSPRHTKRILADYRENGAASLAHCHRGCKPSNATPEATRSREWCTWLARFTREPTILIWQSCSVNERASTLAGLPSGASWSAQD